MNYRYVDEVSAVYQDRDRPPMAIFEDHDEALIFAAMFNKGRPFLCIPEAFTLRVKGRREIRVKG